jgi:hypothetical protein
VFQGFGFILIRVYPRRSAVRFLRVSRSRAMTAMSCDLGDSDQCQSVVKFLSVDKKIFWLLFTVLGALMGFFLPLLWNLVLTLPLLVLCWWVVYRSGWFS